MSFFLAVKSEYPNHKRYAAPKYLTITNKAPIVSAIADNPRTAIDMNARSPSTIPIDTEIPFEIPNIADLVTTRTTLELGTAASAVITRKSETVSKILIVLS